MTNLNKVLILCGGITILGLLYRANTDAGVNDINSQQASEQGRFHETNVVEEDLTLNNTKSTLNTIMAEKKQADAKIDDLETEQEFLRNKIASMERQKQATQSANPDYELLVNDLKQMREDFEQLKNNKGNDVDSPNIEDTELVPIGVTDYEETGTEVPPISNNSIVDMLVQPAMDMVGVDSTMVAQNPDIVQPIDTPTSSNASADQYVWIKQSDVTYVQNEDGTTTAVYPQSIDPSESNPILETNQSSNLGDFQEEESKPEIPIYTVPQNSTLFGSVGMSAILGRVPIGNELNNPFRFKVSVGVDNLATNNLFMPNLATMVVSGYAEGDFTLECARGMIDKVTFTFKDSTVREITSSAEDSLGWISDAYGVPCISGEYITNFPEYMAKQAGLTALSSFAGAIADSAVTTTTNVDGVTTQIVNDSTKNALGEGFQSGTNEITKWYAERQGSAFDVVFVPTGEPVVINIEKALHIDYEPEGRKLIHADNAREYLGW